MRVDLCVRARAVCAAAAGRAQALASRRTPATSDIASGRLAARARFSLDKCNQETRRARPPEIERQRAIARMCLRTTQDGSRAHCSSGARRLPHPRSDASARCRDCARRNRRSSANMCSRAVPTTMVSLPQKGGAAKILWWVGFIFPMRALLQVKGEQRERRGGA